MLKQMAKAALSDETLFAARRFRVRSIHWLFAQLGFNVAKRSDYYSPLPVLDRLARTQARWSKPSELSGVRYDIGRMRAFLLGLHRKWQGDFDAFTGDYAENCKKGFGPGYPQFDARVLFYMLREIKPKRYLEVGSGLSTFYASRAAEANTHDGHPLGIRCIEPYPYDALRTICSSDLVQDEVQNVPLSEFLKLEPGDVLFIDSSHALKIDSDVAYLILEVLPRIAKGVHIHIHDVPFPHNVPFPSSTWIFGQFWPMYWNEAMVVQAFLTFNSAFDIELSAPLIRHFDEACLASNFPGYRLLANDENPPSALWLVRTQ